MQTQSSAACCCCQLRDEPRIHAEPGHSHDFAITNARCLYIARMDPWSILGWAICVAGTILAIVYAVGDRAKGRLRCPRCWYDLSASPNECPECGRIIRSARDRSRTRRKPAILMFALLAGMVGFSMTTWTERMHLGEGPSRFIPTSILIFSSLPKSLRDDLGIKEPLERTRIHEMWDWQRMLIARRLLAAAPVDSIDPGPVAGSRWPANGHVVLQLADISFQSFASDTVVRVDIPALDVHLEQLQPAMEFQYAGCVAPERSFQIRIPSPLAGAEEYLAHVTIQDRWNNRREFDKRTRLNSKPADERSPIPISSV